MIRYRWFAALVIVTILLLFASAHTLNAAETVSPGARAIPAAELLNPDGTINLHSGRSGSVDLSGWSVLLDPQRGPVLSLADSTHGASHATNGGADSPALSGGTWTPLDNGVSSKVNALAVNGTTLYVGGAFTEVCGNANCDTSNIKVNRVAKWDGSNWSALGNGVDGMVNALAVSGSTVYVGGSFAGVCADAGCGSDSVNANNIAVWNGSSWAALSNGVNGPVDALVLSGSTLYAGGAFTNACGNANCTSGNTAVNHVAKWDGSNWSALGNGVDGTVNALAVSGSTVYVGGSFAGTCADAGCGSDSVNANNIAVWNGSSWSALGNGVNGPVDALVLNGSTLYVGGAFTNACGNANCTSGNTVVNHIAAWNGSSWSALDNGLNGTVRGLALSGSTVYVGGDFDGTCSDAGCNSNAMSINHIAAWDGSSWSVVGNGVSGPVTALALAGTNLYAGGNFGQTCGNAPCNSGNITANNVAKFNTPTPTPTPTNTPTNTPTVTNTPTITPTPTNTPTVTNTPPVNADLAIVKTAQVGAKGTQLIYWLTVTNRGPLTAQNLVIKDPLPPQVRYLSISAQTTGGVKCTYSAATRTVTCTVSSLAVGKSIKVGILVQILDKSKDFTNCGTVRSSTFDANASNNQSCLTLNPNLQPVALQDTHSSQADGLGGWLVAFWQTLTGWLTSSQQQASVQ